MADSENLTTLERAALNVQKMSETEQETALARMKYKDNSGVRGYNLTQEAAKRRSEEDLTAKGKNSRGE